MVRVLRPGDESALPPFFAAHPDTTLFLQSNLLAGGLDDRGEPLQGTYQRLDRHFVLERDGQLLAYAAYNASTPDCVQLGGVYTPPPLRSRGYGRAVVAGALLRARARGVRRSVLFTPIENTPAKKAYRALGYERVGDYALLLFADPVRPVGL